MKKFLAILILSLFFTVPVAAQQYYIYFANQGIPAKGLTPSFDSFANVDNSLATEPAITALSNAPGWYTFTYTPTTQVVVGVVNGGTALTSASDREVPVRCSPTDGALANLNAPVSAIPTNPLLTTDTRLNNLDAAISSRSTFAGGAVASVTAPVTVGTNNDKTGYTVATVQDKTGYALTSIYNAAESAASQASVTALGSPMQAGTAVTLAASQPNYAPAKDGDAMALTPTEETTVAGKTWDVTLSGHLTAGTTGASLNAAGSAGDPWATTAPGAYASGTFGYLVSHNLNAPVGSILTNPWVSTIEGNMNAQQMLRIMYAVLAGTTSGGGTSSLSFYGLDGITSRLSETLGANNNRTVTVPNGN